MVLWNFFFEKSTVGLGVGHFVSVFFFFSGLGFVYWLKELGFGGRTIRVLGERTVESFLVGI